MTDSQERLAKEEFRAFVGFCAMLIEADRGKVAPEHLDRVLCALKIVASVEDQGSPVFRLASDGLAKTITAVVKRWGAQKILGLTPDLDPRDSAMIDCCVGLLRDLPVSAVPEAAP